MKELSRSTVVLAMLSIFCSLVSAQTEATDGVNNPVAAKAQEEAAAQPTPAGGGGGELQKAVQNPVASLISVPIQNNSNFGIGPNDRTQNVLNIQPVIPIRASENWNLIIRWITPVISQPAPGTSNL
jgi:hypothetical protein